MKANGLARLGRDAELRYTPSGTPVCTMALAFDYGRRDNTGNRPTQWVDGSLWGDRATALAPHLKKGAPVVVWLSDVHVEHYQGTQGQRSKLVATVQDVELLPRPNPSTQESRPAAPTRGPAPTRQPAAATAGTSSGFDDMDDDIPF